MKSKTLLAAGLLIVGSASSLFAADAATADNKKTSRIEVVFQDPEKFADVKDSQMVSERARDGYLEMIKEHLERLAPSFVPEGHKLSVTFTDIDMAGDFEPWRANASDVRIVRDIYPPRIDLSYTLTDASGAVVKEGKRALRDLAFQMNISPIGQNEPLRYEKRLLEDWLRSDFGRGKSKK
jgi:hypothetical protein